MDTVTITDYGGGMYGFVVVDGKNRRRTASSLMLVNEGRVAAALPGYDLGDQLGAGAFGLVLAGRHRRLNRPVAIKILAAGHDGAAAGFAVEAQLLAALDHPHVVRVYDYVAADDLHLIVMELLGGGTLTRRRAGMPPEDACAVGLAAATALSYAHGQGVLHRDIKTDNMLFDATGLLKITDFGIAKLVEGSAATASAVKGTPAYMAPEQITGGRLSPATDLYALGIVLYHLLAGSPPFDPKLALRELWQQHLARIPPPPAGVPAPLAEVILHALAKDPAARPPSAHAFALDLARAATETYGPDWTARSGIALRLDDEVRRAVERTLRTPSPALPTPPPAADSSGTSSLQPAGNQLRGGASGGGTGPTTPTPIPTPGDDVIPMAVPGVQVPRRQGGHSRGKQPAMTTQNSHGRLPDQKDGGGDVVSRRRHIPWPARVSLVAVIVLGVAAVGVRQYILSQYYVGVDNGRVAIFNGVEGRFIGISPHRVSEHAMPVSELTDVARSQVNEGHPVGSLVEARKFIAALYITTAEPAGPVPGRGQTVVATPQ